MTRFRTLTQILKVYALVLLVFFIFRLVLFLTQTDKFSFETDGFSTLIRAFIMGVRFDVVISGYVLFFPALILSLFELFKWPVRWINQVLFYVVFLAFVLLFAISAADIPYFNQFFQRFSVAAFKWIDSADFVFAMIIQEPKYFIYIALWFVLVLFFFFLLRKIFKSSEMKVTESNRWILSLVTILMLGFIFLGMRGRIQKKSPIRVGTAYFCNNAFLNQLGLNPAFTLMRSHLDAKKDKNKAIALMDDQQAINLVQKQLGIDNAIPESPIVRFVIPDTLNPNKPNVVLILMEGMSTAKMSRHGNPHNLTPFLDSLANESYYFEQIYTAGKHTYNGVFGTLFSFPSLFLQHHLKDMQSYNGMASTLKNLGYSTTYFTTHDGQFDNVEGFLFANDFERVISQKDYPVAEVKTTLGVPDDYLFRFALPVLDEMAASAKPFFVTFMTASDHGPFYIPDYFTPKDGNIKEQIVAYADWSLRQFIEGASEKTWFKNTLFVFIADHGAPIDAKYDIALNYHHSPLLFYGPELLGEPKSFNFLGGQIDVFPTLMGLLQQPYLNNTLGIDLLKQRRPYIYFNDDDKIGVLSDEFFLIFNTKGEKKLFRYKNKDTQNLVNNFPDEANQMEAYAKAQMQVFQYMLVNQKLRIDSLSGNEK